jgi:hypothetical protein
MEYDFSIAAQFAEMKQTIAMLEARIADLESAQGESSEVVDASDTPRIEDVMVDPGGGGSFIGNTEESEEVEGDVVFESADDSNVEVTTEKRTEGDEEINVIKIGVYYI